VVDEERDRRPCHLALRPLRHLAIVILILFNEVGLRNLLPGVARIVANTDKLAHFTLNAFEGGLAIPRKKGFNFTLSDESAKTCLMNQPRPV
jgi:hypothetical protein